MIVQLYRDNYTTVPTENLITTIYNGFFDGVENWFLTAVVANTDIRTSNLTSLSTITNNQINTSISQSIKVSGVFRARKTGTYRFFTYSSDKNILEIDGDDIIVNNNLNQLSFANKSLIAGRYYPINLYYGNRDLEYPPTAMASSTTNITGQSYGNGTYIASGTGTAPGYEPYRAFDKTSNFFRFGSYPNPTTSTTTTAGPVLGHYLQIQLPSAIILKSYSITPNATGTPKPRQIKLLGNNNLADPWNILYEINVETFNIKKDVNATQAYLYYRYVVLTNNGATSSEITELKLYVNNPADLQSGYIEPNDDGTNGGSTNPDDFVKNATGLITYYDINPETQSTEITAVYPLLHLDHSLQGLYQISPLALYYNRTDFNEKGGILYLASEDLFNNFNGTYKNYIQIHERPVSDDGNEKKKFRQFSSDMSFVCELDGKIEVSFRRGNLEPVAWRYVMLILDLESIPVENI